MNFESKFDFPRFFWSPGMPPAWGLKSGLSIWKFTKRGRGSSNFRILNISSYQVVPTIILQNISIFHISGNIFMIHWLQAIILDSVKRSFSKDAFFEKCIHRLFKLTISQNIVNIVTKTSNVTENKKRSFQENTKTFDEPLVTFLYWSNTYM